MRNLLRKLPEELPNEGPPKVLQMDIPEGDLPKDLLGSSLWASLRISLATAPTQTSQWISLKTSSETSRGKPLVGTSLIRSRDLRR